MTSGPSICLAFLWLIVWPHHAPSFLEQLCHRIDSWQYAEVRVQDTKPSITRHSVIIKLFKRLIYEILPETLLVRYNKLSQVVMQTPMQSLEANLPQCMRAQSLSTFMLSVYAQKTYLESQFHQFHSGDVVPNWLNLRRYTGWRYGVCTLLYQKQLDEADFGMK